MKGLEAEAGHQSKPAADGESQGKARFRKCDLQEGDQRFDSIITIEDSGEYVSLLPFRNQQRRALFNDSLGSKADGSNAD